MTSTTLQRRLALLTVLAQTMSHRGRGVRLADLGPGQDLVAWWDLLEEGLVDSREGHLHLTEAGEAWTAWARLNSPPESSPGAAPATSSSTCVVAGLVGGVGVELGWAR